MVFQNYALYPHMSVFDNMAYGLQDPRLREGRHRGARRTARPTILELGPLLERKPRQLSGGQRQRVAMGRAIVREPAVFLFDEPLSNLDAKLRVQMRFEIQKLHRRLGTTSLYVTHDQVEAMTLAHRMIVMNAGRAEQIGTPMEVYENPATLFVAGLHRLAGDELPAGQGATAAARIALEHGGGVAHAAVRRTPGRARRDGRHPARAPRRRAAPATRSSRAPVEMVEQLGADTLVARRRTARDAIIARVPHGVASRGRLDAARRRRPARVFLFDAASGARIR